MNREDIIRLAMTAGFAHDPKTDRIVAVDGFTEVGVTAGIERFAALATEWGAKQEREACAKVCEGISKDPWTKVGREHAPYMEATAIDCAETIRKRGEVKP